MDFVVEVVSVRPERSMILYLAPVAVSIKMVPDDAHTLATLWLSGVEVTGVCPLETVTLNVVSRPSYFTFRVSSAALCEVKPDTCAALRSNEILEPSSNVTSSLPPSRLRLSPTVYVVLVGTVATAIDLAFSFLVRYPGADVPPSTMAYVISSLLASNLVPLPPL